jgi:hypothetical protein
MLVNRLNASIIRPSFKKHKKKSKYISKKGGVDKKSKKKIKISAKK